MTRPLIVALSLLALGACNADAPPAAERDAEGAEPVQVPESAQAAESGEAPERVELPRSVLGTFDASTEQCAVTTTMARLTLTPDSLLFYYGYATVDAVTFRDGGYNVEATLLQKEGQVEVRPEPASYRINAFADSLRFQYVGTGEPSTLVRCP